MLAACTLAAMILFNPTVTGHHTPPTLPAPSGFDDDVDVGVKLLADHVGDHAGDLEAAPGYGDKLKAEHPQTSEKSSSGATSEEEA